MDRHRLPAIRRLSLSWLWVLTLLRAQEPADPPLPVIATFKGTRLYNWHTIENLAPHHWEFRVAHRFGDLYSGVRRLWGIDDGARVRLSFDYGLTSFLTVGLERSGEGPLYNAFAKVRLLTQKAPKGLPFTLTLYTSVFYGDLPRAAVQDWTHRLRYFSQIMLARKFSRRFSAQIGLGWLHENYSRSWNALNDYLLLPILARLKLTRRFTLGVEVAPPLWRNKPDQGRGLPDYQIPFAFVCEIETGGHVFQLGLSRTSGIADPFTLLNQGTALRLGFNISRIFALQHDPSLQ